MSTLILSVWFEIFLIAWLATRLIMPWKHTHAYERRFIVGALFLWHITILTFLFVQLIELIKMTDKTLEIEISMIKVVIVATTAFLVFLYKQMGPTAFTISLTVLLMLIIAGDMYDHKNNH